MQQSQPNLSGKARAIAVGGLLLTLLLPALDGTIVATALPRILREFGGLERYAWVAVVYLLTSTVTVPLAGKLSDRLGRKPLLLVGCVWFITASALCGAANSLTTLIAFRALQGVGGGIVIASVFAGVPELFSPIARARLVGLFTGTFGLASVVGPLLGGVLTDVAGWRSVFLINLPLGLIAMLGLMVAYPSRPAISSKQPIDYLGALTLVGGVGAILLAVSLGGRDLAWTSPIEVGIVAIGVLLIVAFIQVEARAADPIIPLDAVRSRALGIPTLSMGLMAMGMFSTGLFVPLFAQGVLGRGAAGSGTVLAPMMLSFVAASVASSQLISRVGHYRLAGVSSMVVGALGLTLLSTMGPGTSDAEMVRNLIVTGLGLGSSLSALAIANQNSVPLSRVGMANALGAFTRSLGGTVGSAGLGAIVAQATGALPGVLPPPEVLAAALHTTFVTAAGFVIAGGLIALLVKEMPIGQTEAPPGHHRSDLSRLPVP